MIKAEEPKACYFLSLTLENVACFGKRQTLNLTDENGKPHRWTTIVGNNGTGKTTLLKALAGMGDYYKKKLLADKKLNHSEIHFELIESLTKKPSKGHRTMDLNMGSMEASSRHFLPGLQEYIYAYGGARTNVSNHSYQRHSTTDSLFNDNYQLINPEKWLIQADYLSLRDSKYKKYKSQVEEVILELLPDVEEIKYEISDEKKEVEVFFKTSFGWVTIDQLSLGYRTMMAWMVDFTSNLFDRYPESENPLAEPAILLVDEIDLHLHPTWQKKLTGFLLEKFPKTQFIVTAHSPLVIQSASEHNLVLLKKTEDGKDVEIDNNPVSVKNWRIEQILTSDLFGLETTLPPKTEELMRQRNQILSKSKITKKDKEQLSQLEKNMGDLPYGDTAEEIEADTLIKKIAQRLAEQKK
jgi:predicted ATP-binding protein involved in virulence